MNDDKTALVLGATGGIGGEVARQLQRDGWSVRALQRRASQASLLEGFFTSQRAFLVDALLALTE